MSLTQDRLYQLLPALHRIRDAGNGEPLRALLGAFAQELAELEANVEQLYDDQFIETCADWVVPYIGDLIGYRPLHGASPKVSSPRAEVAHTIGFRRRKGTALMLEELAQDITTWPAHAVELFQYLATTQYLKHVRPGALATANLRDTAAMFRVGGAFDSVAHTAEMRRPEGGSGRYNVPNVALFLWRLEAFRLSAVKLTPQAGDASGRKFRVNPLGADLRLFRSARTEDDISHLSEPVNVPEPLSVRLMARALRSSQASVAPAPDARLDDDYGPSESVVLLRPGNPPQPLPAASIIICDLSDILDAGGNVVGWNHEAAVPQGKVGLDPERGRVLLGAASDGPLLATFHYGQASAIGGGEYARAPDGDELKPQIAAVGGASLQPALDAVATGGRLLLRDSLTYAQTPVFKVTAVLAAGDPGHEVVVAAADGVRPLIAAGGEVVLQVGARGRLVIDGVVFSGGALRLPATADNEPRELVLRDCTLVPGLALSVDGTAVSPGHPSLVIEHPFAKVTLERCILGPLFAVVGAEVSLRDCLLDAGAPDSVAYASDSAGGPGAELTLNESTLVGKVHTNLLRLASNSIFFAQLGEAPAETWPAAVVVERKQEGCLRFCYLPLDSITPGRFRCVPSHEHPDAFPQFASLRYGTPSYGQLRQATPVAIREGASDGNEMGVLHSLAQPQRETNLRIRLDEYLRIRLHAGIFYVT